MHVLEAKMRNETGAKRPAASARLRFTLSKLLLKRP